MLTPQRNLDRLSNYQRCRTKYEFGIKAAQLTNKRVDAIFELREAHKLALSGRRGAAAAKVFIAVGEGFFATIGVASSLVTVDVTQLTDSPPERALEKYEDRRLVNAAELDVIVDCGMMLVEGVIIAADPTKITIITVGPSFAVSLAQCFRSVEISVNRSKSWFVSSNSGRTASKVIDGAGMVSSAITAIHSGSKLIKATGAFRRGSGAWERATTGALTMAELANVTLATVDVARKGSSLLADDLIDVLCDDSVATSPPQTTTLTNEQLQKLRELSWPIRTEDLIKPLRFTGPAFEPAR